MAEEKKREQQERQGGNMGREGQGRQGGQTENISGQGRDTDQNKKKSQNW